MGRGCPTPLLDLLVLWHACGIRDRSQGDYPLPPQPSPPPPPPPCHTHTLNPFTPRPPPLPTHTHAHLLLQSQRVLSHLQRTRLSRCLAPPPTPSLVKKLSLILFLCVAGRAFGRERGKGRGMEEEPWYIRRRESLVLYKSFTTLCSIHSQSPFLTGINAHPRTES